MLYDTFSVRKKRDHANLQLGASHKTYIHVKTCTKDKKYTVSKYRNN